MRLANHPNWHPKVVDPASRKELFAKEFPEFFKDALTPSRRRTPLATPRPPTLARPAILAGPPASSASPRFCWSCGAGAPAVEGDVQARFCWSCGALLAAATLPPKASATAG